MAIRHSSAYPFTICSAQIRLDSGISCQDYILWHLSHRFTCHALRLTRLLNLAFTLLVITRILGFPLQTRSPLHIPLILYDILSRFIIDDQHDPMYLSRIMHTDLINRITINISHNSVIARLFIRTSISLRYMFGVPFCHRLCTCIVRQWGLLGLLYSMVSQPQVQDLRSAAD